MPLTIPSLDDLRNVTRAQFAARIPGADMTLRRGTLFVIAEVLARLIHPLHRALAGWYSRQLFKASMAAEYLDREAGHYGIARIGATTAAGNVTFAGTDGIVIPAGTTLQTSDGLASYATQANVTIASGTATAAVLATTSGVVGNAVVGATLALKTAIAGVQPIASVASGGLTGGVDAESDDSLRARLLTRLQQPPQGGAATDYLAWGKLTAGVTRVWVIPLSRGLGTVDVYITMDNRASNIPLAGDLTACQAAIDAKRPVTADVLVLAPTADSLTVTIDNLSPDTAAVRTLITDAVKAMARRVGPGGTTIGDGVSATNPGGTLYLSQIHAAIQSVGGIDRYDLTAPSSDVTYATGHIPATPTVTFV